MVRALRGVRIMPFVFGPRETVGTAVVAGSGNTPTDDSCDSRGVVGWLVISRGSYSKTSSILSSVGENGERGLS